MNSVKSVYKAVIPVAGLGTRMLPATKAIPKELLPIYDRPIIEHVVKEAINCGISEIIFVTRSGKEAIENHFDAHYELEHRLVKKGKNKILENITEIIPDYVKISSIRQADALGLGHAILCAKHLVNDEPFAVLLPDVLVLDKIKREKNFSFSHLMSAWNKTGIGQVMVEQVVTTKIEKYGIIDIGGNDIKLLESTPINSIIEKPSHQNAPSNLAVLGRYILPPEVFDFLENIDPGVGNEIQLTDALLELQVKEGLNAVMTDASIYDCGNKLGYLSANLAVGMQDTKSRASLIALFDDLTNDDFKIG
jgi:UTP--glucose-1-phosphate uridylyltransferase